MKKISYICDMCGKNATINYYEIDFKQHSDKIGRITTAGASRHLNQSLERLQEKQPIYCEKCITKIENYINCYKKRIPKMPNLNLEYCDKRKLIDYIKQFDIEQVKQLDLNIIRTSDPSIPIIKEDDIQYLDLNIKFTLKGNKW